MFDDPFVVLESTSTPVGSSSGVFSDPLSEIGNVGGSRSTGVNGSSVSGGAFDDLDPLDSLGKSVPPISTDGIKRRKDPSPARTVSMDAGRSHQSKGSTDRFSVDDSEVFSRNRKPSDNPFDMPSISTDSRKSARATSPPSYMSASPSEASQVNSTPKSEEIFESTDEVWLTVSEIPLFTQPTSAPPPSRPPPPRPTRVPRSEASSYSSTNARKKANEYSSFSNSNQYSHSPSSGHTAARSAVTSQIDELEEFATGRTQSTVNDFAEVSSGDDVDCSAAAAAAAKQAMDRAEAKFRHAKEMRERESLKAARNKESVQQDREEIYMGDSQDREFGERQERQQREKEEEERRLEREREEKEREQRRLERERARAREMEERERARQAVERATREARERAAAEARLKAERAAVDKANAAARERAERAAVQRAQAEARERAAAEAKERAEKAAAEARERANAEARDRAAALAKAEAEVRLRAERAAVERAAREARERASVEARERAAAATRASQNQNQPKSSDDLESFFSMGSRPSSAPRPRANSSVRI